MNFGKFDQKTVEKSMINTIFDKQQVIFEHQKLLHFPRAWALVAYKLVACIKKKCINDFEYLGVQVGCHGLTAVQDEGECLRFKIQISVDRNFLDFANFVAYVYRDNGDGYSLCSAATQTFQESK